ncbi:SDR family NAD(P)-dependent oxidoreductase [Notoacmeibacter ruber]|uniref:SDR family NAD(P)-dependent oxidoreductase n=1 Tax=Notoacmeibacter ruber TaxID=2670375 RepID=A0A3L7JHM4_9HYPH|nr:SDR family NAD(P)-dependent oxidoreductase [Notoacmeibacter ruber]RLQ89121.1 SDR family NAD(P)-dependent oxidoreductase [Notoacmeibacter ruber]
MSEKKTLRTLIVGASGGIGLALAERCAQDGEVLTLSRTDDGLDITDESSIERGVGRVDGDFDRIFLATGILSVEPAGPERRLEECKPESLAYLMAVNAIGPLMVLKHLKTKLVRDTTARIGVLSARVGSIGDNRIGGWYGYRASKAALNQYLRCAAIELSRSHKSLTLVALHPGTVETPFTAAYQGRHKTVLPREAAANLVRVLDRLATEDTGGFFDQHGEPIDW